MASALRLTRNINNLRCSLINLSKNTRWISTTPKKQETLAVDTAPKTVEDFRDVSKQKNWVSWGFDTEDKEYDTNTLHATMFVTVTLCMVVGGFFWAYAPDPFMRDWAQREAFLVLRRREAAGLEPVPRDYVDPSKIELPSDEELGDTEIII